MGYPVGQVDIEVVGKVDSVTSQVAVVIAAGAKDTGLGVRARSGGRGSRR